LYEFRKAVANEDATFLEGKCLSYSRGVSYHPIIDILKANFDIRDGDGDSEVKKKVKRQLKELGVDKASTLPYLLELLSVKDSGIDKIPMSPEERKVRITDALNRIVLRGSELRPLIMAFEDLHWSDKSSEESLKDLLDSIAGARVFLIFTYRPEFVRTWGARSYHSQVNLNRLSNRESLSMVTHLLETEEIDNDLEELILEKTEGIPFFIEEFIKSLKDLQIIERKDNTYRIAKDVQTLTIPATIHDVIMARVDSLPEGVKALIQIGSVIEREFSYELIKKVTDLADQELLSHLSVLKDSELLYERGIYPETTYIFKHALTRDVVYDSILVKGKKGLHGRIANGIEELCRDNLDEHYGVLAEHYINNENYEKGAEYSKLAGKKAIKAASPNDAIRWAEKWVLCLGKLPDSDATKRKIIDARTALAGYYINLSEHAKAKDTVAPIADLALELNYQKKLPSIYTTFGIYNLYHEENFSAGFHHLNEALNISEKTGNFMAMWFAGYNMGCGLSFNCEFENALGYLNKCLELSTLANNPIGIIFTKGTMSAFNYVFQGKLDLAFQTSEECLTMADKSDDIFAKGLAHSSHGTSCYYKGFFDEAEINLSKAVNFCEKTNTVLWSSWASFILGHVYSNIGKNEEAEDYYKRALGVLEHTGLSPSWINALKILIGRKSIKLNELFDHYKKIKIKFLKEWVAQFIIDILLNLDDLHLLEAEDWIKRAIKMHERDGMTWHLGRDYALYAELFRRKGDIPKAKENLNKAIEILKKCGADGWVKKYKKELATLSK